MFSLTFAAKKVLVLFASRPPTFGSIKTAMNSKSAAEIIDFLIINDLVFVNLRGWIVPAQDAAEKLDVFLASHGKCDTCGNGLEFIDGLWSDVPSRCNECRKERGNLHRKI